MSEKIIEKSYAEQIAHKKKIRKLATCIVSLSLVLMISITVIVLACVRIDLKPSVITNPYSIYFNSDTSFKYYQGDEKYDDFFEEYDKAFNISYLSAIFSGRANGYEIVDMHDTDHKSLPDEVKEGDYVTFIYNDEITLTKPNNTTYYSIYNPNYSIDFTEVTFALSSEDKQEDMTMYLKYNWNTTGSGSGTNYYAQIKLKANTYNLYRIYKGI